jgi:peptidoglycan hydrolase-like protein with peptidoglycan-binding domain
MMWEDCLALKSRLFQGDQKLEQAAKVHQAHIAMGASGDHVKKIQYAVSRLNGEPLEQDGKYGPLTSAAVLAYKKKRNIINSSYQSQADDIVGVMTVASLDAEIFKLEQAAGPVRDIDCSIAILSTTPPI